MEPALAAFSSGRVLQPVRKMLTIEEDKRYLGIMLAVADEAMLVSFYPGNAGSGFPNAGYEPASVIRRLSLNRSEPAKKSGQNIPKNRCRTTIAERDAGS